MEGNPWSELTSRASSRPTRHCETARGRVGITVQTGKRLHGDPGSPEFIADIAAAEKLIRDRIAGTFNNLVRLFTLSSEFETALAPSTQTEYRRMMTKAEAEFGDMPVVALDDPRVRREFMDWREKAARASGEREADNRLSAVSAMLTWAIDRGHIAANHLRGFKRLYHATAARSSGCQSMPPLCGWPRSSWYGTSPTYPSPALEA